MPKNWFWDRVATGNQQMWSGFHEAVLGVAYAASGELVTVYSEEAMVDCQRAQVSNYRELNGQVMSGNVTRVFLRMSCRRLMQNCDFGPITPFYVRMPET